MPQKTAVRDGFKYIDMIGRPKPISEDPPPRQVVNDVVDPVRRFNKIARLNGQVRHPAARGQSRSNKRRETELISRNLAAFEARRRHDVAKPNKVAAIKARASEASYDKALVDQARRKSSRRSGARRRKLQDDSGAAARREAREEGHPKEDAPEETSGAS